MVEANVVTPSSSEIIPAVLSATQEVFSTMLNLPLEMEPALEQTS